MTRTDASIISVSFLLGLYFIDDTFSFFMDGAVNATIDVARATTPPSFDGTDRKIAYANRKYHSGWI